VNIPQECGSLRSGAIAMRGEDNRTSANSAARMAGLGRIFAFICVCLPAALISELEVRFLFAYTSSNGGLWRMSERAAIRQPKKINFFPAFAEVTLRFHNRFSVSISFALTARFFLVG